MAGARIIIGRQRGFETKAALVVVPVRGGSDSNAAALALLPI